MDMVGVADGPEQTILRIPAQGLASGVPVPRNRRSKDNPWQIHKVSAPEHHSSVTDASSHESSGYCERRHSDGQKRKSNYENAYRLGTQPNRVTYDYQEARCVFDESGETGAPGGIPVHITAKLRDKFERRILRQGHGSSLLSSDPVNKVQKYRLLAAFLVNDGVVEAWHIYAPMPVDMTSSPEEEGKVRILELTQRRLRLLQRYYSDARQYVILYVNSNLAEHYLPMGLAVDSSERRYHRHSSHPDFSRHRNHVVTRFLSSIFHGEQHNKSECTESSRLQRVLSCSAHQSSSSPQESVKKKFRRDHSLPQLKSDSTAEDKSDPERSSQTSPKRSSSKLSRSKFMRRILGNICNITGRQTSVQANDTATICGPNFEDTCASRPSSDEVNEKESSTSGLADFSSISGSSGSENVNCAKFVKHLDNQSQPRRSRTSVQLRHIRSSSITKEKDVEKSKTRSLPPAVPCHKRGDIWLLQSP
ncbi:unnamed protein product [Calicophoron daubneyi]|uniref:Uncharacterized protein n=1 Tax=Calicophoron daubneyi TaxID=300641 RepID=A0AAV2TET9_CALDB